MRIIQITDLHIGKEGADSNGVDVRGNFLNILAEVKFANAEHLVITGDLCLIEGEEEVYYWIKERLDKLEIPYHIIPGNHDDTAMMREVFELDHIIDKEELFYGLKLGKQTCLFMDNSQAVHSDTQIKWLKRQLYNAESSVLLFTHYPPVLAGVPFMDANHALQDIDAIQEALLEYTDPIHVFCGHYHVEKSIHLQQHTIHITPSCYVQIRQDKEDFEVDHHRIAMRIIDVQNNLIQTTVRYIDGVKLV